MATDRFGGTIIDDAPAGQQPQQNFGTDRFGGMALDPPTAPAGPVDQTPTPNLDAFSAEQQVQGTQRFRDQFNTRVAWEQGGYEVQPVGTNPDGSTAYAKVQVRQPYTMTPEQLSAFAVAQGQDAHIRIDPNLDLSLAPAAYVAQYEKEKADRIKNAGAFTNFSNATLDGASHFGEGFAGTVAPDAANRMAANTREQYAHDADRASGMIGGFAGNTIPMVPAMLAGPGGAGAAALNTGTAAAYGTSTFGQVRMDVAARRAAGQDISTEAELGAAATQALIAFAGNKIGLGAVNGVEQAGLRSAVQNAVFQYAKAAGINATDNVVQTIANNAVDAAVLGGKRADGSEVTMMQGTPEAAATGLAAGVLGKAANHAVGGPAALRPHGLPEAEPAVKPDFLGRGSGKFVDPTLQSAGLREGTAINEVSKLLPPAEPEAAAQPEKPNVTAATGPGPAAGGPVADGVGPAAEPAAPVRPAEPPATPLLDKAATNHRVHNGDGTSVARPVEFEDKTDKALYAASAERQGKVGAEAKAFLAAQGMTPADIAERGAAVRGRVKGLADAQPGTEPIKVSREQPATTTPAVAPVPVNEPASARPEHGVAPTETRPESVVPERPAERAAGADGVEVPPGNKVGDAVGEPVRADQVAEKRAYSPDKPATDEDVAHALTAVKQVAETKDIKAVNPKTREQARFAQDVARISGRKVQFVEGGPGSFVHAEHRGVLFVNVEARGADLAEAAIHELHHQVQRDHPEVARELEAAFGKGDQTAAAKLYGEKLRKLGLNDMADRFEKDVGFRQSEVGATLVGKAARDPRILEALTGDQRSATRKFVDRVLETVGLRKKLSPVEQRVKDGLAKVREALAGQPETKPETKAAPAETKSDVQAVLENAQQIGSSKDLNNLLASHQFGAERRHWSGESEAALRRAVAAGDVEAIPRHAYGSFDPKYNDGFLHFDESAVKATRDRAAMEREGVKPGEQVPIQDFRLTAQGRETYKAAAEPAVKLLPRDPGEERIGQDESNAAIARAAIADRRVLDSLSQTARKPVAEYLRSVLAGSEGMKTQAGPRAKVREALTRLETGPVNGDHPYRDELNLLPKDAEDLKAGFRTRGHLPQEVADVNRLREGRTNAEVRTAQFAVKRLERAVKESYGVKPRKLAPAETIRMYDALQGKVPLSTFDPPVAAALAEMRKHVDKLTGDIQGSGLVDPVLSTILGSRLGEYLNRSYRVFDDPKWQEKIPATVMSDATALIEKELTAQGHPNPTDRAKVYVKELLSDWQQGGVDSLFGKAKLGAKNLTILKTRGDISKEIRALMGEYQNPFVAYAKSVTKMANLASNHTFLEQVKSLGSTGGWLHDGNNSKDGYTTRIAAPESSSMAPLNGMRTSPEIAKAFGEFNKVKDLQGWAKTWAYVNFAAKQSKTVYSAMTQARNILGQPFFNLLSGHYRVSNYGKGLKSLVTELGGKSSPAMEQYVSKMHGLGVLGESVQARELMHDLRDMGVRDTDVYTEDGVWPAVKRAARGVLTAPQHLYSAADALGKVYGFENELARAKEAYPGKSLDEQERIAADRVVNTYPTYSKLPPAMKALRRQPLLGPFTAFWYESMRTYGNSVIYAAQDLKSGNPALRRHGAERLAGLVAVTATPFAVQAASKMLLGMDTEDEKGFRQGQPDWSKNDTYMFTGKSPGKVSYWNVSAISPYGKFLDAVNAVAGGKGNVVARLTDAAKQFLSPMVGEQIFTGAVVDAARNKTQTGGTVYSEQDSPVEQWTKILGHVLGSLEPGTTERFRQRILPALRGEQTTYGDALSPTKEIVAETTGVKTRTYNYESGLRYQAAKFGETQRENDGQFLRVASRPGTVKPDEVLGAYDKMEERRQKRWHEMRDYVQAAQKSGLDLQTVYGALLRGGLNDTEAVSLIGGAYTPYDITGEAVVSALQIHPDLPIQELAKRFQQHAAKQGK